MPSLIRGKPGQSNLNSSKRYRDQAYELVKKIISLQGFEEWMARRTRNYLLLSNTGSKVLGFATMKNVPGRNRLDLIGTLPGKGYGKVIMNAIYEDAKKRRIPKVNVLRALQPGFYGKFGYTSASANSGNSNHSPLMRRSVSRKAPTTVMLSERRSVSVTPSSKRKRSPASSSVSPTSKRRATPPRSPLSVQ